jgi:hypothetical protein
MNPKHASTITTTLEPTQYDVDFSPFYCPMLEQEMATLLQISQPRLPKFIDQSTQTDMESKEPNQMEPKKKSITKDQVQGHYCPDCQKPMSIYGPYGQKKHQKRYGCFWYQCPPCSQSKLNKNLIHKVWIDLGFFTEQTETRKSTNYDEIVNYIRTFNKQ